MVCISPAPFENVRERCENASIEAELAEGFNLPFDGITADGSQ